MNNNQIDGISELIISTFSNKPIKEAFYATKHATNYSKQHTWEIKQNNYSQLIIKQKIYKINRHFKNELNLNEVVGGGAAFEGDNYPFPNTIELIVFWP